MPYLVSPSGKIVAEDDKQKYDYWLTQPGFRAASEEETRQAIKAKLEVVNSMNCVKESEETGIYIFTVSEGGRDGYGISSKCLISELKATGIPVARYYKKQKIGILFHNPYSILNMETPYRIIYTMFESDKIPDDWRDYLEAADKVIVPSKWCQGVFQKAGIKTTVIPLGYDDKTFKYIERPPVNLKKKSFTFLHYNAFNIRKGFPEVLKAFTKAFEKTEPVKMIFKTTLDTPPLPLIKSQYPNIEVITGKKTEAELVKILKDSDAFVFPSRGEGFGITPLEAMATGLPAIVPNAHGITEYFNADYMYQCDVSETCPALYSRYKGMDVGKMVVCDVDQLAKQMRWVYEHPEEARAKGKAASEYVKQWTFENTAKQLKSLFEDVWLHPIEEKPIRNVLTLEKVH